MNSSWLLLNVFRRRLWLCLFIEFVIVLFVALDDINPGQPKSMMDSVNVAYGLAVVLSLFLWFQTGCNRLPFPVSIRQRAWLPMIAFATIWAVGCVALLIALPSDLFTFLPSVVGRFPLYILAFLIVSRFWCTKPHLISLGV